MTFAGALDALSHARLRTLSILLVMALASLFYLPALDDVRSPIWDEAYYLTSTARYHEGRAQFASHPPLGLMLIAAGDRLFGDNDDVDLSRLVELESVRAEQMPPAFDYAGPRYASAIFGVAGAVLFFALMLELTGSLRAAWMLVPLWLLDPLFIAQFRAAQLDSFQLTFVLAALLSVTRVLRKGGEARVLAFGLFATCSVLVRANAALLIVCVPFVLWPMLVARDWRGLAIRCGAGLAGFLLAMLLVTVSFAMTSRTLPDPQVPPGSKHDRFVSADLRTAIVSGDWTPSAALALWQDQWNYVSADLDGVPQQDANGSHPWDWLTGSGAITYLWSANAREIRVVGVVPNRPAWLLSLLGVLGATAMALRWSGSPRAAMLLSFWCANMIALLLLDGGRVLYSYHYLIPLIGGYGLLAMVWRNAGFARRPAALALPIVAGWFVLTVPLAIHYPVSIGYCEMFLADCGSAN